jgi:hypothetical protein
LPTDSLRTIPDVSTPRWGCARERLGRQRLRSEEGTRWPTASTG